MTQAKKTTGEARSEMKKLVHLVQGEIDRGATSVEEIHKAIANLPLDVLERLDLFEQAVKGTRKVQEARIGAMYDLIRKVNEEVAKIAQDLLARRPPHRRILPRPRRAVHAHAR